MIGCPLGSDHALGLMIALARKAGYAFTNTPDDWKLTRFQKEIPVEPQEIPCASWRLAAVSPSAMSSLAV